MQVMINDCPVDFDVGTGENVSDIVDAVSGWSRERNLIFYELYIDENLFAVDKLPDVRLDRIKMINCIVQSKADIVFSSIDEASRYCDRVAVFIHQAMDAGECSGKDTADMLSGVSWLVEVLSKTMSLLGVEDGAIRHKDHDVAYYMSALEKFMDLLREFNGAPVPASVLSAHREMFSDIKFIFKIFLLSDAMKSLIVQSIDSPDVLIAALAKTKEDLPDQLMNIRDAAIAYQTGRDPEGAERLNNFVDFIYRYHRTCYQVVPMFRIELTEVEVDGLTLEQKNRILRDLLSELITVMENNDIISLSDTLEYEIMPALGNLDKYIDALLKGISRT